MLISKLLRWTSDSGCRRKTTGTWLFIHIPDHTGQRSTLQSIICRWKLLHLRRAVPVSVIQIQPGCNSRYIWWVPENICRYHLQSSGIMEVKDQRLKNWANDYFRFFSNVLRQQKGSAHADRMCRSFVVLTDCTYCTYETGCEYCCTM